MTLYLKNDDGAWTLHEGDALSAALAARGIVIGAEAIVGDGAYIGDRARVGAWASIGKGAYVGDGARVGAGASVGDLARVGAGAIVGAGASVGAEARVGEGAYVGNGASVGAEARVGDLARVGGLARVAVTADCIVLGPLGRRHAALTGYRGRGGKLRIATGCFDGTPRTFLAAVKKTHGDSPHGERYRAAVAFLRAVIQDHGTSP